MVDPEEAPLRGKDGTDQPRPGRRTVDLPTMKPDQVAYLRSLDPAASRFDPEQPVRGRKPPMEGVTP